MDRLKHGKVEEGTHHLERNYFLGEFQSPEYQLQQIRGTQTIHGRNHYLVKLYACSRSDFTILD